MAPQKQSNSERASQNKKRQNAASTASTKSSPTGTSKPTCMEPAFWAFPGFLWPEIPVIGILQNILLQPTFTDQAVLDSQVMGNREKNTIMANNTLAVLFKALLFHRDYYHTCKRAIFKLLGGGNTDDFKYVEKLYVSARRAYLAHIPSMDDIRTVQTDLVDKWISVLNSQGPKHGTFDTQARSRFDLLLGGWSRMVKSGDLIDAGYRAEDQKETRLCSPDTLYSIEDSGIATHDYPGIKQEQEDDNETDSPSLISSSDLPLVTTTPKHQKRKASTLVKNTPKRRRISHTSDDQTSESDSDTDVEDAALAEVRKLAEKRHARYASKLQKMKARHSAQKKRVADLEQQVTEIGDAQSTHASLSPSVKLNSKSLKQMVKGLEQQKGTVDVLQKLVKEMECRLEKMEPPPRVKAEEVYQKITVRLTDKVKDEVKTTWKGAALELSNTRKVVDEHGQRVDTLDSHISQQQSITERHEKSLLNLADISVKQTTRISLLETDLQSKVDGHAHRLTTIESQLARQSQGRVKSEKDMPQYPPHIPGFHRTAQSNEFQEMRAIIDSQGKALAIQGRQMGEMAREMDELKAMAKDVPNFKEISKKVAKEVSELKGWSRDMANWKEVRATLSTVLGRQSFGEQRHASNGEAGKELVNLNEVSKEMGNFKQMRTTLASVLNRQTFEEALASRPASSRPSTPPGAAFQSPVVQQALQSAVDLKQDLEAIQRSSNDKGTAARVARMMEKLENLEKAIASPRSGQ